MFKKLWGRIKCALGKHGRRKRGAVQEVSMTPDGAIRAAYYCPRCADKVIRTIKPRKAKAAQPIS